MIKIAHRGLLKGVDLKEENNPRIIDTALNKGYFVEVDAWMFDNEFYLGHDEPRHKVSFDYINHYNLFVHCKNLQALRELSVIETKCDVFAHDKDPWVLTKKNYIWTLPGGWVTDNSIIVDFDNSGGYEEKNVAGICSDLWN